jgi:DegV family protein with EDD domain
MLRIVTDGAADMPPAWEKEFDIHAVPINIRFGEKSYLQNVDLDTPGFYRMVQETGTIPKTSQPSPHQFVEFYKKVAQPGDTIISIHVTSVLSGTYASAVQAAEEVKATYKVFPVDSAVGSVGIGLMCREIRKMDRAGKSAEEIVKYIEDIRHRVRLIVTLDTLEFAKMSGRVKTLQAALASLLNVKPIAILRNGDLKMAERVRTRKASIDRVLEIGKEEFGDKPVYLAIVQANDMASGEALMAEAKKCFNYQGDVVMTDLSISVAANLGPGTVGVVLYPVD